MVLVIEDDAQIRELLCEVIEQLGIKCVAVGGNKEAMEKITNLKPSIILVDMLLEDGKAIPVLKLCKERFPETTVILTTALRPREVQDTISEFDLKYCIHKPFSLEDIESLLLDLAS